ncbi:Acyl-coenzyme A thioesterase 9, mitochondrial [Hondaea fermentalgiana]|uniref:Acyl-coenzyme A thioesterase 9, mitochondrial n=1 Tax=Hondaea fermentalgiana TaxID=2315210 RepID=A0A2R5FZT5_9STRA|nr:Acyl-coenzyme A thioesterase 9, mitochondrial [Hondaea fermentalgiana]|eukprot:GBG24277.1 Acyl-coenzyme A thioesterase 9, mitochondrial [Hondaea fermentalgiana]
MLARLGGSRAAVQRTVTAQPRWRYAALSSSKDGRRGDDGAGQHKTPIVNLLWELRDAVRREREVGAVRKSESKTLAEDDDSLEPQTPISTEVLYEFSKDASLKDKYLNPWHRIRVGNVIEDLDALAGNVAFQHCSANHQDMSSTMLVTASVDRITMLHRASLEDDVKLSGCVSWVGTSSMEIKMQALSSWSQEPFLEALFTFVARDRVTGRARRINPLKPETPAEKAAFEAGRKRADHRKQMRKQHKDAKFYRSYLEDVLASELKDSDEAITIEQAANALYNNAKPRLFMPAIALKNAVRLSETRLSNTFIMQPQERNTAGRIFGGFLVRRAYELAFATAYVFGGAVPRFSEVDEVVFRTPVDVGDLVHFESCVLFTSKTLHANPSIHVEILASVVNPEATNTHVSNSFNFTFEVPPGSQPLSTVLPETRDEALNIATRFYGDVAQKIEDETLLSEATRDGA